jgi:hypothetical protein
LFVVSIYSKSDTQGRITNGGSAGGFDTACATSFSLPALAQRAGAGIDKILRCLIHSGAAKGE